MELPDIMIKGNPLPQAVGRRADLYHDIRELRLAMEKEIKDVKDRETEIKESIISDLSVSDDTGAAGLKYRAQLSNKRIPKITDWNTFMGFVAVSKRFDMVQHRLSEKAVTDWNEQENNLVPGTEMMNVPDLSITKV